MPPRAPRSSALDAVVVTGPPASGKTTVARAIAADLGWPLFEKDALKEVLFDELGVRDRQWSRRLGGASAVLLYRIAERELAAGRSFVLEANFTPARANAAFAELARHSSFRAIQVYCTADAGVLEDRYTRRAELRHPGHDDLRMVADVMRDVAEGRYAPLALGGPLIEVSTTSVGGDGVRDVLAAVRRALG